MGQRNYRNGFRVTMHEHMLQAPKRWKRPRNIFVNSMSDLFHPEVPFDFIRKVFGVMGETPWHQFQILTKRSERLVEFAPELPWHPNIWMGVSVENEIYAYRIDHLRTVSAAVRFISFEPLVGRVRSLNLTNIDWVIVGGESGPGARAMRREWVVEIRDKALAASVPFFFKQWGGTRKKKAGRLLDGTIWNFLPGARHGVVAPVPA